VLFITDRDDASLRYRCVNASVQLRESGVIANICRIDDSEVVAQVRSYSIVVLFRLPWSHAVRAIVEEARRCGVMVALDIDDLIFDPSVEPLLTFLPGLGSEHVVEYRRTFAALHATFVSADYCIVSTPAIAERARTLGKVAIIHPNILSREYIDLA